MTEEQKFKYLISPDNTYILDWDDGVRMELTGGLILSYFRREAYMQHILSDPPTEAIDIIPES